MHTQREIDQTALILAEGAIVVLRDKGWAQKWFAYSANNSHRYADSHDAVCFCSIGALSRARIDAGLDYKHTLVRDARDKIDIEFQVATGFTSMAVWNDEPHRTKDEVLAVFSGIVQSIKERLNEAQT